MKEKEIFSNKENNLIVPLSAVGLFVIASLGAFSKKTRKKIWKRDGGVSSLSGKGGKLHAAHIDHSRDNPRYDDPSNGRMLKVSEHYKDHYNRHGRNGLSKSQNKWSLNALWGRLSKKEKEHLPPPSSL